MPARILWPRQSSNDPNIAIRAGRAFHWICILAGFAIIALGTVPLFEEFNRYRIQENAYVQKVAEDREQAKNPPKRSAEEFLDEKEPAKSDDPVLDEIALKPQPIAYEPAIMAWVFAIGFMTFGRIVRYVLADE